MKKIAMLAMIVAATGMLSPIFALGKKKTKHKGLCLYVKERRGILWTRNSEQLLHSR